MFALQYHFFMKPSIHTYISYLFNINMSPKKKCLLTFMRTSSDTNKKDRTFTEQIPIPQRCCTLAKTLPKALTKQKWQDIGLSCTNIGVFFPFASCKKPCCFWSAQAAEKQTQFLVKLKQNLTFLILLELQYNMWIESQIYSRHDQYKRCHNHQSKQSFCIF